MYDFAWLGGGGGGGGGGLQPKKTVPNLKLAVASGFFGYFSVWTSTRNSSHSKIMLTMRSWEAKNCPIKHLMPREPCKSLIKFKFEKTEDYSKFQIWHCFFCSGLVVLVGHKSFNLKLLWPTRTTKLEQKKTVPNLKFAVVFVFFWVATPPSCKCNYCWCISVYLLKQFILLTLKVTFIRNWSI